MKDRAEALDQLLLPIGMNYFSSIKARQLLVNNRRAKVKAVIPFLDSEELTRAEQWMVDERHGGLWE